MGLVRQENSNMNTVTPTVNGHGAEFENRFPHIISAEEPMGKPTAVARETIMVHTVKEIGLSSPHELKIENCTLTKRSAPETMKNNNEQTNFYVKSVRGAHLETMQENSRKKTGPRGSVHEVASSVGNLKHANNYHQNTPFSSRVTKVKVTPIIGNGNSGSFLKEVNEEPGANAQTDTKYTTSVSTADDDMLKCRRVNSVKLEAASVNQKWDKNLSKNVTRFVGSESENVITVKVRHINLSGNDSTFLKDVNDNFSGQECLKDVKVKPSCIIQNMLPLSDEEPGPNLNSFRGQACVKEVKGKPAHKIQNILPETNEELGPNLCHGEREVEDCVDGIIVGVQKLRVSRDNENEKSQSKPLIRERGPKRNNRAPNSFPQESNLRTYPPPRLTQSLPKAFGQRNIPEYVPISFSLPPFSGQNYDLSGSLFNSPSHLNRAPRRTYALASGGGITGQSSNDVGLVGEHQRASPITIPVDFFLNTAPDSDDNRSTGSDGGFMFGNMSPMGSENSSPLHSSESTGNVCSMDYGTLQSLTSNISSGSSTLVLASSPYQGTVGGGVSTDIWNNFSEQSQPPFLNVATTPSSASLLPTRTESCETAESILNSICGNTITTNPSQTDASNFANQFLTNYADSTENITFNPSSSATVPSSQAFGPEHVDQSRDHTDNLYFDTVNFIETLLNCPETQKSAIVSCQNEPGSNANPLPAFSTTFSSRKMSDPPDLVGSVGNAPIMAQMNIIENPSENAQSYCSYNPLTSSHSYTSSTSEAMLDVNQIASHMTNEAGQLSINNLDSQSFIEIPATLYVMTESSSNLGVQNKVQEVESFSPNSKDLTAFTKRQPSPASSLSDHAYSQSPSRSSDLLSPYTDTTYLSSSSGTPASVRSENSPISATSQESDEFLNSPKEISSFDGGNKRIGVTVSEKEAAVKKIVDSLKEVECNPNLNPSTPLHCQHLYAAGDQSMFTRPRTVTKKLVPIRPKPNLTVSASSDQFNQRTMQDSRHARHNSGSTRSSYSALLKQECKQEEVRRYCEKYSVGDMHTAIFQVDNNGNTAMHNAFKQKKQNENKTDLACAFAIRQIWFKHFKERGVLQEYKQKINHQNKDGQTPLLLAIANGYVNFVGYLLEEANMADSTIADMKGDNVFHYAAKSNKPKELIELLCKLDSCPTELITRQNRKGETPLSIVVSRRGGDHREKLELVKLLLWKQTRLDIQDEQGKTALHRAIQFEDIELVEALLNHAPHDSGTRALSMQERNHGYTPLHMVATLMDARIQKELAQTLIVRNESIRTIRDFYKKCPYELVDSSRKEVIKLMTP